MFLAPAAGPSFRPAKDAPINFDPLILLVRIAGFVVAISVHEFFHAFTAWRLGDPTAKNAGRLTLNPLRHLDPFGSLLLLIAGFGWGRPVPVDPRNLRYGRFGMAMVSGAGPLSNLVVAFLTLLATVAAFANRAAITEHPVPFTFLISIAQLNVVLCLFNLLPIAPLDGFGVVVGVLPWSIAGPIARLGQYGPGILMLLVFLPRIIPGANIDPLGALLGPARIAVFNGLVNAASFIVGSVGLR